ncbi:MAG TPA: alpha/beta hydrolase [Acidimicrobiales bacterium]
MAGPTGAGPTGAGPTGAGPTGVGPTGAGRAEGSRVILVHGSMDRATSFRRLMSRLPEWHCVAYDRRGYAGSSHMGPPESFEDQVDDLLSVLDSRQSVVFGHSYGGNVVLAAASRHPDLITAAVVWEPPRPWLPWWPGMTAAGGGADHLDAEDRAEWFMRRMVGDRVWERLPEATRSQRRREGPTLTAELELLRSGPPFDESKVRIPVLVGRGGQSPPHHRRSARELASSLPKGELCDIAGASHGAHLTHPAELAELIRSAGRLG